MLQSSFLVKAKIYVNNLIYSLNIVIFFLSGSKNDADDRESTNTYEAADYSYDSTNGDGDYVEEPQPSLLPSFTTEAQTFKVAKGRLIRLPCRVDRLGKTLK